MCTQTKFVRLVLPLLLLLSSCSGSEEDYRVFASVISNFVLIDVLDSDGNSLIDNEDVMKGLAFIDDEDGYEIPFRVVETGGERLAEIGFPLPMHSAMRYSDDRKNGYGESGLVVNANGFKFHLRGKFHFEITRFNMYGCNGIKIIEIHSNDPNVSVSEDADCLKVTIKIASD